jgi:transcription elongation factor GreA
MEGDDLGLDPDAEFEAAKNDQAFLEGRIKELEILLANARIVDEINHPPTDAVAVGTHVTVQEEGCDPEEYIIVGAAETDPHSNRVSNESPLGRALMDHHVDDNVTVEAPGGAFTVRIIKIR